MAHIASQAASATGFSSERIAAIVFGVYLLVALPILVSLGSHYWFAGDEWAFFVGGSISDPAVLFRPVQSHWSTLPILVYRALYSVFGLHSYLPFQLCVILLHLTLCCLLRVIMRRVGVGPWIATVTAATLVLFGPAETNILAGVQISQVGSIVLGFSHLLLADHDGPIDRRDWLGLLCGLGSIMSSGIGPPLVMIVGLAAIIRRGWLPAIFHTLPLAAVYVIWWLSNRTISPIEQAYLSLTFTLQWVAHGMSGVFLALAGNTIIAIALGALLLTGLLLAWTPLSLPMLRQRASLPAAMLIGAAILHAVISTQRWTLGVEGARQSHYIGLCAALILPALAVAADAVVRRWQWMMPVVCVLFLIGLGINTTRFGSSIFTTPAMFTASRTILLAVAHSPFADQAPPELRPAPSEFIGGDVDMAFLIEARNSGRLPPPPEMTEALASQAELRLSVQQISTPIPASLACAVHSEPLELNPKVGDFYKFTTPILISIGESGTPLPFNAGWGSSPAIRILRAGLHLHLAPKAPATSFGLCK
jgi:hypothetical protein